MNIRNVKFYKVEAEHAKEEKFNSVSINLSMKDGAAVANGFRVDFLYSVVYQPNIGKMNLSGYVLFEGTKTEVLQLATAWKKDKILPKVVSEEMLNAITFQAQCNGVLIAKALAMTPPLVSPRIQVQLALPKKK